MAWAFRRKALTSAWFVTAGLTQLDTLEASDVDETFSKGLLLLCRELENGGVLDGSLL